MAYELPDLLMRWSEMDEAMVLATMRRIESKYPLIGRAARITRT